MKGVEISLPAWEQFNLWVFAHLDSFILVVGALLLGCFILSIAALRTALLLKKRYQGLMMGREGVDLEELLSYHRELLEEGIRGRKKIEARLKEVEEQLLLAVTGVGLVRYNAFRETGSDLSFSLALLDRNLNGVVLTSLFGREESRCYGKPVKQGQSSHYLSDEENQALEEARRQINARRR